MNRIRKLIPAAAGLLTLPALAATPSDILTVNPGFLDLDSDTLFGDGWGVFGAAAVDFQFFGDGNAGHATLFADMAGNSGGVFQAGIPATAGTEYELTIKVQFETNWDADTFYGLEFYAADDATKLGEQVVEIVDEFPGAGYRRYNLSATAPAGTAFVRPLVRFENAASSGPSRAATVDNVLVREADDVLNLNPGFGDIVGNGVNGDQWGTFGAAATDLDFFNNGNPGHATLFGDMAGNSGGIFQLGVPAIPGESYTFTVDIAFEDNWDAVTRFGLEFYGADDAFLVGETVEEITETPGVGYLTYEIEAVAPSSFTSFVRPIVSFDSAATSGELRAATVDNAVVQLTSTVSAGCNAADVAEPFATLDIDDVLAFLNAFAAGDAVADVAPPAGTLDIDDVLAFLNAFAAGCP